VDFKETAIALDPNHEASIFEKGGTEKLLKRHAICISRNIEATNDKRRNA
jgi:hypothetical protein